MYLAGLKVASGNKRMYKCEHILPPLCLSASTSNTTGYWTDLVQVHQEFLHKLISLLRHIVHSLQCQLLQSFSLSTPSTQGSTTPLGYSLASLVINTIFFLFKRYHFTSRYSLSWSCKVLLFICKSSLIPSSHVKARYQLPIRPYFWYLERDKFSDKCLRFSWI